MHLIGTVLVLLGFLDFGLYLIDMVFSTQLSFIPPILVFLDRDFTGFAIIMVGYILRESGGSEEQTTTSESPPDDNQKAGK